MKKIFSVLFLGTALTLATACDDKKADDKKADDKKADAKAKADDKKADDKKADEKKADEAKAEEKKADAPAAESTGAPECDELVKKTNCMYEKTPGMPAEAKKGFEDMVKGYTAALKNEASKQATIDACKAAVTSGKAGFDAIGC